MDSLGEHSEWATWRINCSKIKLKNKLILIIFFLCMLVKCVDVVKPCHMCTVSRVFRSACDSRRYVSLRTLY